MSNFEQMSRINSTVNCHYKENPFLDTCTPSKNVTMTIFLLLSRSCTILYRVTGCTNTFASLLGSLSTNLRTRRFLVAYIQMIILSWIDTTLSISRSWRIPAMNTYKWPLLALLQHVTVSDEQEIVDRLSHFIGPIVRWREEAIFYDFNTPWSQHKGTAFYNRFRTLYTI